MLSVTLWRKDDVDSGVSLVYLGDATVSEFNSEGRKIPHCFKTKAEAVDFIIRSAYGLLAAGYEIFEPEEGEEV